MSKGLEALAKFCESINACINSGGITRVDSEAEKQVEKQLKALEIIKNKAVNVLNFLAHFIVSKPEYDEYQYYLDNCEKYDFCAYYLTRQEFDLLKEVLR